MSKIEASDLRIQDRDSGTRRRRDDRPSFGTIANGCSFIFLKLVKGERPQYGLSKTFATLNPVRELYDNTRTPERSHSNKKPVGLSYNIHLQTAVRLSILSATLSVTGAELYRFLAAKKRDFSLLIGTRSIRSTLQVHSK